jgi:hypothetical protein
MLSGLQCFGFLCWYARLTIGGVMALLLLRLVYPDDAYASPTGEAFVTALVIFAIPAIVGCALPFLFAGM